ncbi:MAG: hypothetical protein ACKVP3_05805 [Hyphomicrobiaceae bacterium]
MRKPIEFYFDFASPYGFLAAMQIDALAHGAHCADIVLDVRVQGVCGD